MQPAALLHLCFVLFVTPAFGCVLSFFLYMLSKMFLLPFSFLLFSCPPPCLIPVFFQNRATDTKDIAPGLFGLALPLSPSFSCHTYLLILLSHLLSFFPFIYFLQVLSLHITAINMVFHLKPRGQYERSYGILEVRMLNMLSSKDVLKIWVHLRDVKRLNLFFPVPY